MKFVNPLKLRLYTLHFTNVHDRKNCVKIRMLEELSTQTDAKINCITYLKLKSFTSNIFGIISIQN